MLEISERAEGILVRIRAVPRAGRSEIDSVHEGALKIRLKAPPVGGAANDELCAFLSRLLRVRKADVEVVRGMTSRTKTVLIRGVSATEARARLCPA